jgi:hypothetical protein
MSDVPPTHFWVRKVLVFEDGSMRIYLGNGTVVNTARPRWTMLGSVSESNPYPHSTYFYGEVPT